MPGCSFGFGVVIFLFVLCYGMFVEIEIFWGWVVFELLGVGEDFVSRWGLVLGVCLICLDRRVIEFWCLIMK